MKLTKKLLLKLISIPLITLAIIFLGIYAVNKLVVNKYWWYYNFDDGLAILERNPAKVLRLALTCPENNENPFQYEYPSNGAEGVDPYQLIVFQAKPGYIVDSRQIKISQTEPFTAAWGYHKDKFSGDHEFKYPKTNSFLMDRIIFYRYSEMRSSLFDKLFSNTNNDLSNYPVREEFYLKDKSWSPNDEITIRFGYKSLSQENNSCMYPYTYKLKTKSL